MRRSRDSDEATTSAAIAALVGGRWINAPAPEWRLQTVRRGGRALRSDAKARNMLVPLADPHRWIPKLDSSPIRSNAAILLVSEEVSPEATRFAALKVDSIDEALATLANHRRERFQGKVVAVTGSVGKSTTTAMIARWLTQNRKTYWPLGKGNVLGSVTRQCVELDNQEFAVFEVDRNALAVGASIVQPDIAIVTAVAEAHMEHAGSLEAIARIKSQIFAGTKVGGTAIISQDTPHADILLDAARSHGLRTITYGISSKADAQLVDYDQRTGRVAVDLFGTRLDYQLGASGTHNALNSLAAICAIDALEEDVSHFSEYLKTVRLRPGRGTESKVSIGLRDVTLVDHSYNANPTSMRAALTDFGKSYPNSRRILVLGDMRELGPTEATLHADLLESVAQAGADRVYLLGPLMVHLWARLPQGLRGAHVNTIDQLRAVLATDLRDGDAVMVKASRDTGLNRFVKSLTGSK